MRRGLFIAGLLVVAIGLGVVAYTQLVTTAIPVPEDPSGEVVNGFHVIGSGSATLHWSGGIGASVVHVYECTDPSCTGPTTEVTNGSGPTGSVHFAVAAQDTYEVNTTGGPPVNGTIALSGLTDLGAIGLILVATGAVLAAWSLRRGPARPSPPR